MSNTGPVSLNATRKILRDCRVMFKFAGQAGAVSREPKEAVAKYCVGAENVAVEVHNVSTEINHLEKTEKTQGSQISQQPQNIN